MIEKTKEIIKENQEAIDLLQKENIDIDDFAVFMSEYMAVWDNENPETKDLLDFFEHYPKAFAGAFKDVVKIFPSKEDAINDLIKPYFKWFIPTCIEECLDYKKMEAFYRQKRDIFLIERNGKIYQITHSKMDKFNSDFELWVSGDF